MVKHERGARLTDALVEMRGLRGGPQPSSWTLLFNDPTARGGVREIVVQDGAIASERTPLRGFSGVGDLPAISSARWKINSPAVFQTANSAAVRGKLGFHWLDYTLRADADTGTPLWILDLINYMGVRVGSMTVSGETGTVLRPLTTTDSGASAATVPTAPERERGGLIGGVERLGKNVGTTVWRGTLNVVGVAEEWITGERTIGLEED